MKRCVLAVYAQQVARDAETNLMSVFSIIDEINIFSLPAMIASMAALFFFDAARE